MFRWWAVHAGGSLILFCRVSDVEHLPTGCRDKNILELTLLTTAGKKNYLKDFLIPSKAFLGN